MCYVLCVILILSYAEYDMKYKKHWLLIFLYDFNIIKVTDHLCRSVFHTPTSQMF